MQNAFCLKRLKPLNPRFLSWGLASPEAGRDNCLPYVLAPLSLPASQEDKYRDKNKKNKFMKVNLSIDSILIGNINQL